MYKLYNIKKNSQPIMYIMSILFEKLTFSNNIDISEKYVPSNFQTKSFLNHYNALDIFTLDLLLLTINGIYIIKCTVNTTAANPNKYHLAPVIS